MPVEHLVNMCLSALIKREHVLNLSGEMNTFSALINMEYVLNLSVEMDTYVSPHVLWTDA